MGNEAKLFTAWSGYLPDHTFEDDETNLTWREAQYSVLDALSEEARHAQWEFDESRGEDTQMRDFRNLYDAAILLLEHTREGELFDVLIRDERFAVLPV